MRLAAKIVLTLIVLGLLATGGGYLWLRSSPYWAGITLFAEDSRVENFRNMDQVFPARDVAATGPVWEFDRTPAVLPETYRFDGEQRPLGRFLDETVTTGLLVLHNDAIAVESYWHGADETARFTSWSVAKSVLSALIGIAIEDGHISSVSDPITDYVPELAGSGYDGVTIEDALTMSSGVAFNEDYADPFSDINRIFISLAAGQPMIDILAGLESDRAPGTFNAYVSADSIALGLVLEAATGIPNENYLSDRLWQPMGAETPAYWSTGRAGRALPFCCLNATLRDYARFGRLVLAGGVRDGVQILPADWVEVSTRPTAPRLEPGDNPASDWSFGYGYHWWVPENPQDEVMAIGIWGQFIYLDRARNVVIVKTSVDEGFDTRDHETVAAFRAIAAHIAGDGG